MSSARASQPVSLDDDFVARFLAGKASEDDVQRLLKGDAEIATFTLLAIQQRLASLNAAPGANTPPASIPAFNKPPAKNKKNRKKRGAQQGHKGSHRVPPPEPDRTRQQKFDNCPDCGGKLKDTGDVRTRLSEDIPDDLKPVVTKDIIHRDWCPKCKKRFEPKPPDLLPHCQIGNRTLVLSSMLHYLQGLTISQIVDTFNFHLRLKLTHGGLVQMWHRLAKILYSWYQEIHQQSLDGSKLHADETGWRVEGQTHWLWCFTSASTVYFMVDKSRGSPALQKFFTRYFDGTLITDFWSPYDAVDCADKQKCWPHLLRDMSAVDEKHCDDKEWASFSRRVAGVFRDAKKLHASRAELSETQYDEAVVRLEGRLYKVAKDSWQHADANRLAKRMAKYGNEMLTFLWYDDVASDNNAAERAIRPAVMIRKNSYANQSEQGATTMAVMMSVFRTLKLRNVQPIEAILDALKEYNRTGKIPKLPENTSRL